jgi:NADPH2:quinone reductase
MMNAMVFRAPGRELEFGRVPEPTTGRGEVLVEIVAAGLNPLDLKIRAGEASHAKVNPPAVLGLDMAGRVVGIGADVNGFRIGDEVYGFIGGVGSSQGALAELAAVDAALLAPKPKSISMREAAALPLITITAWEGLVDRARVTGGMRVLVQGGAGGVGHVVVQLARAFGAEVCATGSPKDESIIRQYAAAFIDYASPSLQADLDAVSRGHGFDIIYDTVGGKTLEACFPLARRYTGHVVSCLGWGTYSLAPLSFRGATYSGVFTLYPLLSGEGRAAHGEILRQAGKLIEEGKLKPLMDATRFKLADSNSAYRLMETRGAKGRVVVDIAEE